MVMQFVMVHSKTRQSGVVAWIIKGKNQTNWIIRTIHTLGTGPNHSAFQSNSTGLFDILLMLCFLNVKKYVPIQVACDRKSVLL